MITREDVLDKLEELEGGLFREEWFQTDFGPVELASLLDDLEIDCPNERLMWYNRSRLSIDDFVDLANVDFRVYICEKCGDEGYIGFRLDWKRFQGVRQAEGFGPIVVNDKERTVCGSCYDELTNW